MIEYEKRGEWYILKQGDDQKQVHMSAVKAVMASLKINGEEAIEYHARHLWPQKLIPPTPTLPPKPTPPPTPPPSSPSKPEQPQKVSAEEQDLLDEVLSNSDEVEGEGDDEEEEEEEELDEAELLVLVREGMEDEKTWNDYSWLMNMTSDLGYFEQPGTQKKDKATLQAWLKDKLI